VQTGGFCRFIFLQNRKLTSTLRILPDGWRSIAGNTRIASWPMPASRCETLFAQGSHVAVKQVPVC
jgi:hypothetical protein